MELLSLARTQRRAASIFAPYLIYLSFDTVCLFVGEALSPSLTTASSNSLNRAYCRDCHCRCA